MVANALSHITIGNVSQVNESKKDLGKDVHKLSILGGTLKNSPYGGFMVQIKP